MSAGKLQLERILDERCTCRVGRRIEIHDTVDSTNELAWERVANGDSDGLVIFAEHQQSGRGRLGRSWDSPRGASVLMSLVLHDPEGDLGSEILSLLAAVAATDAVDAASAVTVEIKWPNDLTVNGRKLGGILIESRSGRRQGTSPGMQAPTVYVVGTGINCLQHRRHFTSELRDTATSLDLESALPVDRNRVARHLLIELDRWLAAPRRWDRGELKDAWVRRALPLGRRIRLRQAGAEFIGQVLDVDPAAGLLVQLDTGGRNWFDAASTSMAD